MFLFMSSNKLYLLLILSINVHWLYCFMWVNIKGRMCQNQTFHLTQIEYEFNELSKAEESLRSQLIIHSGKRRVSPGGLHTVRGGSGMLHYI